MLTNLQLGEFIYEQPSTAGLKYTFKRALTQEVAYNSILADRRRLLHEQTARATEQLYSPQLDDHWSELTHHYLLGIDAAKAVHYARLAAEQALSRSAFREASSITEPALKLLDKIPDSAERTRAELSAAQHRGHVGVCQVRPRLTRARARPPAHVRARRNDRNG